MSGNGNISASGKLKEKAKKSASVGVMGGRGASSGQTAGFKNSTLKKNNPYLKLSQSEIEKNKSLIGKDIRKLQDKMYSSGDMSLKKKIHELDFEYAKAEYAGNQKRKKNVINRDNDIPF